MGCYSVVIMGQNVTGLNFTNKQHHCISGRKYDSITGHGLAGWTITATDNSGYATSTTTNKTGYWKICGLLEGNYTVCEILWFVSLWL